MVEYDWCCGFKRTVLFKKHGDVLVTYHGNETGAPKNRRGQPAKRTKGRAAALGPTRARFHG